MDEALKKSGDWPNVAMTPGTYEHAATGEPIEVPESARIKNTEQSIENAESYDLSVREKPESVKSDDSYKLVDTRELLEAEIRSEYNGAIEHEADEIIGWLDRQAAITERQCMERATTERVGWDCAECAEGLGKELDARCDPLKERIAELTAERDQLKAELETYGKVPNQVKCDNCGTVENEPSQVPKLDADGTCPNQIGQASIDTREQLEADVASILRNAASHTSINTSIGDMLRYTVPGSGAAPWQLEEDACEALASIVERQIDKLTAERDEAIETANTLRLSIVGLRDSVKDLTAERDELKHANSLLQSTISELSLKVDEKQRVIDTQRESFRALEARAARNADPVEIQLALARFAEEWAHTDTRVQEQRCIVYHAQHIADLADNPAKAVDE